MAGFSKVARIEWMRGGGYRIEGITAKHEQELRDNLASGDYAIVEDRPTQAGGFSRFIKVVDLNWGDEWELVTD